MDRAITQQQRHSFVFCLVTSQMTPSASHIPSNRAPIYLAFISVFALLASGLEALFNRSVHKLSKLGKLLFTSSDLESKRGRGHGQRERSESFNPVKSATAG